MIRECLSCILSHTCICTEACTHAHKRTPANTHTQHVLFQSYSRRGCFWTIVLFKAVKENIESSCVHCLGIQESTVYRVTWTKYRVDIIRLDRGSYSYCVLINQWGFNNRPIPYDKWYIYTVYIQYNTHCHTTLVHSKKNHLYRNDSLKSIDKLRLDTATV